MFQCVTITLGGGGMFEVYPTRWWEVWWWEVYPTRWWEKGIGRISTRSCKNVLLADLCQPPHSSQSKAGKYVHVDVLDCVSLCASMSARTHLEREGRGWGSFACVAPTRESNRQAGEVDTTWLLPSACLNRAL
jgi:hypothetical protein